MAERTFLLHVAGLLAVPLLAFAQEIPESELQLNLNTYFDNFDVQVIYPSLSVSRKISPSSSVNARYLVDLVTAASIRSSIHSDTTAASNGGGDDGTVDGVTSASRRGEGYAPDDVRHEVGIGFSQAIGGGVLSANGLYSKESDYRSETVAGTYAHSFLKKNSSFQVGYVRSWDVNSPKTVDWSAPKNESIYSFNYTQIWLVNLISQAIFTYDVATGLLSDPYEIVFIENADPDRYEPVHPDRRVRKAVGLDFHYKLNESSALLTGMRYYWDDWDVRSFTNSVTVARHVGETKTISVGVRNYVQAKAFFFRDSYVAPEEFMTVDSKLDRGYSNSLEFKLTIDGGGHDRAATFLEDERVQVNALVDIYHRHTRTENWFSGKRELFSLLLSLGVRYRY